MGPGNDARSPWYHERSVPAALARFRAALQLVSLTALSPLLFPLALGGCAPPSGSLVGVSTAVPEPSSPRPIAPTPHTEWPELAAARAWPEASPATVALAHRRDGTLVHVRVEPAALSAYLALTTDAPMPDGARVIAWHETPSGRTLDGYLLEKRAGSWSAAVINEQGARVPGPHAACLRCHDMAPTDHLFGRAATPSPSSASVESISSVPR